MPDHDTHDLFDLWFFGCRMGQFRWVHQFIDQYAMLFGPEHRRLMHDSKTVEWFERNYGPMVALVVKAHIALDIAVTSMKKRENKK